MASKGSVTVEIRALDYATPTIERIVRNLHIMAFPLDCTPDEIRWYSRQKLYQMNRPTGHWDALS